MKRSILKKMIVLTLAFAMVFSSVITAVSATEAELTATFTATADKESYAAGDTVVVTFAVTGEVDAIGLTYGYDAGLTLVGAEWTVADAKIADVDLEKGKAAIAFDGAVVLTDTAVFAMTFTADADGEYAVTATPVMKNGAADVAADSATATVVVGASHECGFGDWQKDETNHWKECECGLKSEEGAHDYANNCDDTCDACGYIREVGGHEWGDWIIDTPATDSANGAKHRKCSCGETETKVIPRSLKMNTVSLSLANSIAANFKANGDHFTSIGYTDPYMMIIKDGVETIVTDFTIETDSKARRVFSFGITPQMLNDEFEYYLCAYYEGELYTSATKTYKIADYCYSQLRKSSTSAEFKTLYVDLLNYGTALQKVVGKTNYANADLTEAEKALGSTLKYAKADYIDYQNTAYETIDAPTAKFNSVNVSLDKTVELKLTFTLPSSDLSNITIKASNGLTDWVLTPEDTEFIVAGENKYTIYFGKLAAHQLDDCITFTICDNDVAISNTLSYSVESYVNRNIEKSSTTALMKDVFATMMAYGYAAQNAK